MAKLFGLAIGLFILVLYLQSFLGFEDKVVFLDVGQGDAVLLQNGLRQVLIDGGEGAAVVQRLSEEIPRHDRVIDIVVLTHPQQDHMEGLLHVLERYEVGLVVLPDVSHTTMLQEAWLSALIDYEVPYRFAWHGQRIVVGDLLLDILAPFDSDEGEAATASDLNNASVVVRASMHDMSFLLTGDAEARVERMLVEDSNRELLDVDVLKAGHHGSSSSTTTELLEVTSPATFVVSVGEDNRYGHPSEEVLSRVHPIPVLRTDEHGSVRFSYTGTTWVQSYGNKGLP